jgi:hypothetical protein
MKDTIRQASIYTMNGLMDPRLMPGYITLTPKPKSKSTDSYWSWIQIIWRKLSVN